MAQITTMFTLDEEKARSAGSGRYITESGRYIGIFTSAYVMKSTKGKSNAEFMHFEFLDETNREAFFKVCFKGNAGQEVFGMNFIHAILSLLKVPSMKASRKEVQFGNAKYTVPGFPAITNKPIGIVLQRENYVDKDGKEKYNFNLMNVFDFETGKTVSELKGNLPAMAITQLLARLQDKTSVRNYSAPDQTNQAQKPQENQDSFGMEEDVPF